MHKRILIILSLIAAFIFTPMLQSNASARIEMIDTDNQQIKIELSGNTLIVTGAVGKTLRIYDILGVEKKIIRIDSNEKRIDLSDLKRGIYPVKVDKVTKKIQIGSK